MEERIARMIGNISSLEALAQFEANARQRNALADDMKDAIRIRAADLVRPLIAERTGLDLGDPSPAEEKILQAVSEYVGMKKREGRNANRTLEQRNVSTILRQRVS